MTVLLMGVRVRARWLWPMLVALVLVPRPARAQTPPAASPAPEPRLTVGAELFAGYTYTIAPKASDPVDQISRRARSPCRVRWWTSAAP